MSTEEQRLAALEAKAAVLRQRSDDHENDFRIFAPLVTQHAKLEERQDGMQAAIVDLRTHTNRLEDEHDGHVKHVAEEFEKRDQRYRDAQAQSRKDQITLRVALAGLFLTFGGLIVAVVNSLGHA